MKLRKRKNIRVWVQLLFFVLIALIAVNKTLSATGNGVAFLSIASLHALCPFGGVVTLYNLVTVGTFIQKIHMSSVILMGLVLILTVLFGPAFCGWICPLGTIQEWFGKVGHKIFKSRYNHFVPSKIDHYLRYFRYAVLIWVVFVIANSGQLLFENVDPYNALFTFWSEEVALPSLIILIITLTASFFIERPWCKYTCPYGAFLGIFNKIRIFKITRDANSCISCGKCDRSCPMNIEISNKNVVTNTQCISCYECTSEVNCPINATVSLNSGKKTLESMPRLVMAVIVLVLIFGGIGVAMATDVWSTSNDKVPATYKEGEAAGAYNPGDIRGSYTFEEVSDTFEIEKEVLLQAFSISESDGGAQMKIKDLESLYSESEFEIGRQSVQAFVALYKNLPFELEEVYLPEKAVEILLDTNKNLTPEQIEYLDSHTVHMKL